VHPLCRLEPVEVGREPVQALILSAHFVERAGVVAQTQHPGQQLDDARLVTLRAVHQCDDELRTLLAPQAADQHEAHAAVDVEKACQALAVEDIDESFAPRRQQ